MTNTELLEAIKNLPVYDYRTQVFEDVREYYEENKEEYNGLSADELQQQLYDDCFIADSVTGNASGSYFCNTWKAEAALLCNDNLLSEALEEFGSDVSEIARGAEHCDVTIRCYLVSEAVSRLIEELNIPEEEEEEEEN